MRIHAFHHLYQQRLDRSTKLYSARGSKVHRCQSCQVAQMYCLCAYQPDVESDVAVMLIVSENEVMKPSNTGRLILDVVKEGYAFQWSRTEPSEAMLALLNSDRYQPVVIFPDEYVSQTERLVKDNLGRSCRGKKPLLIFLDGSWREARRMFRKSPYLDHLPVFSVDPDTLSRYVMRRSDNQQHLATAEVAVMVLQALGERESAKTLSSWFDSFKEGYLLTKSRGQADLSRPFLNKYLGE
ncbi:tRNA-uridine aminocarboxypropyltransferase [Vibrio ostreicida]|uniref:tRNA-uridine aminocarboxypropyltransferase n=1 Tax=Vibrio ostreicida TaxID=526588 RepID=A0ABT8BTF0_9VIBR|nr:tRNA-uridine aminocarboxypropyltransferase [Vibrio ostreicida]MDN3609954.1 tRNA-uridine aminocarboxypropyltransferase [Vibrio ostreicida]NPD10382.1 DTW domain-containing protein [Vibrio ostreicida]